MRNQRIKQLDGPSPESLGWKTVNYKKEHDFGIKNICCYIGPAMLYDSALNGNYYAIRVLDPDRVEEVRDTFSRIVFSIDDIAGTRLTYYTKGTLVKKYLEALDE